MVFCYFPGFHPAFDAAYNALYRALYSAITNALSESYILVRLTERIKTRVDVDIDPYNVGSKTKGTRFAHSQNVEKTLPPSDEGGGFAVGEDGGRENIFLREK